MDIIAPDIKGMLAKERDATLEEAAKVAEGIYANPRYYDELSDCEHFTDGDVIAKAIRARKGER